MECPNCETLDNKYGIRITVLFGSTEKFLHYIDNAHYLNYIQLYYT